MEKSKKSVGRPKTTVKERVESISFDLDKIRLLVESGYTDVELAKILGVSKQTINRWKDDSPEFLLLLKQAKENADANVERSLYKRALGFTHKDLFITQYKGEIIKEDILKYYPPSEVAMIFWLKNRQPDKWRDKPLDDVTEQTKTVVKVEFV